MSAPKMDKGLQYVRLATAMVSDIDLLDAGDLGFILAVKSVLHSGQHGTGGLIPNDARKVNRFAQFDDGVTAAQKAIDALLAIEFLVPADDDMLLIRSYERYQVDAGGSQTRSKTMHFAALTRWHREGKHVDAPKDDCPSCIDGVAPEVPQAPQAEQAPELAVAPDPEPAAASSKKPGTRELVRDFTDCFPAVFATMTRLDGYRVLFQQAGELGAANADLSAQVTGSLRNAVLADAIEHYLPETVNKKDLARVFRGAKALNETDGAWFWVLAAQKAASQDFESSDHAVKWLTKVAASARTDWLAGS